MKRFLTLRFPATYVRSEGSKNVKNECCHAPLPCNTFVKNGGNGGLSVNTGENVTFAFHTSRVPEKLFGPAQIFSEFQSAGSQGLANSSLLKLTPVNASHAFVVCPSRFLSLPLHCGSESGRAP